MSAGLKRRCKACTTRHANPDGQAVVWPATRMRTNCSEFSAKDRLAYATLFHRMAALAGAPSVPAGIAVDSVAGKSSSVPSGLMAALNRWTIANAVNHIHQT